MWSSRLRENVVDGVWDNSESNGFERELRRIELLHTNASLPTLNPGQIRITWEGEFFAGHSFSNINEQIAVQLSLEPSIALSLLPIRRTPPLDTRSPYQHQLSAYIGRNFEKGPEIVVRHSFPPNWQKPPQGRWVHIQPWEFGSLPIDWLPHLRDEVDEIWVMSKYVESVYRKSGISPQKLHYIPWGIDPDVFKPDASPRQLPTTKTFRFLYVGGTILRKGFDRVLSAYLSEFGPDDDVCLVVKDVGANSFYGPQNMRDQISEAIAAPCNASIVYLDDNMTPGQMASLYTSSHCLVAPYRGEGFHLPVLEALACGVPPIVPIGGPTDDFVDAQSGFMLHSRVVPAEGVKNLVGPATEFQVSIDELRAIMRRANTDRDHTTKLGHDGSERVRREFTWKATKTRILQRFHSISGTLTNPGPNNCYTAEQVRSEIKPLAAVIQDVSTPSRLVDSLARICPFVPSTIVMESGGDERVQRVAQEYGAAIVQKMEELDLNRCDWILLLRAGEYVADTKLQSLDISLSSLPAHVTRVRLRLKRPNSDLSVTEDYSEFRLFRTSTFLLTRDLKDGASPTPEDNDNRSMSTLSDVFVESTRDILQTSDTQSKVHSHPSMPPAVGMSEGTKAHMLNDDVGQCLDAAGIAHGRSGKSVLIQMATGPHVELLELTRDHHRRYAECLKLDYWCVAGNPAPQKRAGWGKITLLLSALEMGYETAIWLDSDAVIVQPSVDLGALVKHGIGMVRHPNPEHWNTGMIVSRNSAEVIRFWREVEAAPENNSAWMEQQAVNELATRPEYAALLHPIELRYNSVPGCAMARSPVVVAAHGLPMPERRTILREALSATASGNRLSAIASPPTRREGFGEYLNELDLIGEAVEVGVLRGEHARILLDNWRGRLLHLVDPWRHLADYQDIANLSDEDFQRCLESTCDTLISHVGRYRIHRHTSVEAAQFLADASLDFVYLDANHHFTAVSQDLRIWFPKLKPGGIMAGHDFVDGVMPEGNFGVAQAVRSFLTSVKTELHVTNESAWPSWYFFKPKK